MGVVYFSIIPTFEPSRYCKCWIVCFYYKTGVRGKGTHEKKKSLKMFKEDAKGGNKSLEEEKKLQMAGGLCAVSGICAVYVLL